MDIKIKKSLAGLFSSLYSCSSPRYDFETGRDSFNESKGFIYALLIAGIISTSDFNSFSDCLNHLFFDDELSSDDKVFLKDFLYLKF